MAKWLCSGYPGDKKGKHFGEMQELLRKERILSRVYYDQWGSEWKSASSGPKWTSNRGRNHTNGFEVVNSVTRIRPDVFENFKKWKAEGGGSLSRFH